MAVAGTPSKVFDDPTANPVLGPIPTSVLVLGAGGLVMGTGHTSPLDMAAAISGGGGGETGAPPGYGVWF